jgi:hypothetical protein
VLEGRQQAEASAQAPLEETLKQALFREEASARYSTSKLEPAVALGVHAAEAAGRAVGRALVVQGREQRVRGRGHGWDGVGGEVGERLACARFGRARWAIGGGRRAG